MREISIQHFKTPYGELILGAFDQQLCLCDWRYRTMRAAIDKRITQSLGAQFVEEDTEVLAGTRRQLGEYFAFNRMRFTIPLLTLGTPFQKKVWDELCRVGYGDTSSYQKIAERIGNKKAVRAVAAANGANAISILIPCHRIIGSNGELTGYAGGLRIKQKLLQLEQNLFAGKPWTGSPLF